MRILILIFLISINNCFLSQTMLDKEKIPCDSVEYFVFDYFRQVKDSAVTMVGRVMLINYDRLDIDTNKYCFFKNNDLLVVKFKNEILYEYQINKNKITGIGICYYPFIEKTAMIGEFKNNKLHGLLYVFDRQGELLEIMKFRRGKYKKHVYFWSDSNEEVKQRKNIYNNTNPLLNEYEITR